MSETIDSTDNASTQPVPLTAAPLAAGLYLVSTPVGNMRDITLRAIDVLGAVDAVLCEDSRVTGKLMQAYGLRAKLRVYNDHSDESDRAAVLSWLESGQALALVTDAGTPLLSDPGYKLVHACFSRGIPVVPVPGASALLPALQLGALPTDRFLFAGFLPNKQSARKSVLAELAAVPATLVLYDSPNRLAETVADMLAVLGDRPVALAREITKLYEESRRGTLAAWAADESLLGTLKGEMVVMVGPPLVHVASNDDLRAALEHALETMSVKDAAAHVAAQLGVARKQAYDMALDLRDGK